MASVVDDVRIGYRLACAPEAVDAVRFEALVAAGHATLVLRSHGHRAWLHTIVRARHSSRQGPPTNVRHHHRRHPMG
jgi:hypothetical protein